MEETAMGVIAMATDVIRPKKMFSVASAVLPQLKIISFRAGR